jgi:hypothetical protein
METKLLIQRNLFFFLFSVAIINPVFSQWCGSSNARTNVQKTALTSQILTKQHSSEILVVEIYFNVLNSSSSSNVTEQQCKNAVENLNNYFGPANIVFRYTGYSNRSYQSLTSINTDADFNNLRNINTNQQRLQVFLIDTFNGGSGGKAQFPGNYIALTKDYLDTFVLAHEIGHNFNLFHTHHGGAYEPDPNIPAEAINGSNCATAGDLICDTPADPRLFSGSGGNLNSSTCTYTGGGGYNPDTENIMSYTPPECGDSFTHGQGDRMRGALLTINDLQSIQEDKSTLAEPIKITYERENYNREYLGDCFEVSYWGTYNLEFQKGFNYSIEVTTSNIYWSNTTTYIFNSNQIPTIELNENYSYESTITDYSDVSYSKSGSAGFVSYIDCPIYFPLYTQNSTPIQSGEGKSIESGLYSVPIHDEEKKEIIETPKILIKD